MTYWTICPKMKSIEVIDMPDYKVMYLKLFRASEKAVNLLITAQQECEELYISEENRENGDKERD